MSETWDRVRDVTDLMIGGPPNNYAATAMSIGLLRTGILIGYGDDPDDALRDLTRRLRERRDGQPASTSRETGGTETR